MVHFIITHLGLSPEPFSTSGTSVSLVLVWHKVLKSVSDEGGQLLLQALEWRHGDTGHGHPKRSITCSQALSCPLAGDMAFLGRVGGFSREGGGVEQGRLGATLVAGS